MQQSSHTFNGVLTAVTIDDTVGVQTTSASPPPAIFGGTRVTPASSNAYVYSGVYGALWLDANQTFSGGSYFAVRGNCYLRPDGGGGDMIGRAGGVYGRYYTKSSGPSSLAYGVFAEGPWKDGTGSIAIGASYGAYARNEATLNYGL